MRVRSQINKHFDQKMSFWSQAQQVLQAQQLLRQNQLNTPPSSTNSTNTAAPSTILSNVPTADEIKQLYLQNQLNTLLSPPKISPTTQSPLNNAIIQRKPPITHNTEPNILTQQFLTQQLLNISSQPHKIQPKTPPASNPYLNNNILNKIQGIYYNIQ